MTRTTSLWMRVVATVLTICVVVGLCPAIFAADASKKSYVSLGASNVNGYGMRGYLDNYVDDKPDFSREVNIYGFEKAPEGSYPTLIAKALDMELTQLAMSSMRAEEIRFLLDKDFDENDLDAYTRWRFYNPDGDSQKWFYGAGCEVAGAEFGQLEEKDAIEALRTYYQEKVAGADLITLDIGINNFGVYLSNRVSGMYDNDMSKVFTEEEFDTYFHVSTLIFKLLISAFAEDPMDHELREQLQQIADILAYALVGYCKNFNETVKAIYELNPDVDLVVVSIQNMMKDLELEVGDYVIDFGAVYGLLVNLANFYTAVGCEYSDKYYYADLTKLGRAEFFVDDIAAYNGDPKTLDQNMLDCFNILDTSGLNIYAIYQDILTSVIKDYDEIFMLLLELYAEAEGLYEESEDEDYFPTVKALEAFFADAEAEEPFSKAEAMVNAIAAEAGEMGTVILDLWNGLKTVFADAYAAFSTLAAYGEDAKAAARNALAEALAVYEKLLTEAYGTEPDEPKLLRSPNGALSNYYIEKFLEDAEKDFATAAKKLSDADFELNFVWEGLKAALASYTKTPINPDLLYKVYDAYAQIMKAGADVKTLTVNGLIGDKVALIQRELKDAVLGNLAIVIFGELTGEDYDVDAMIAKLTADPDAATVLAMAVRTSIGNSFFAHPSPAGHATIAAAILNALANEINGKDIVDEDIIDAVDSLGVNELTEAVKQLLAGVTAEEIAKTQLAYLADAIAEQLAAAKEALGAAADEKITEALAELEAFVAEQLDLYADEIAAAEEIAALLGDEEALRAAVEELVEDIYNEAVENGYIPTEVIEAIKAAVDFVESDIDVKALINEQIENAKAAVEEQIAAAEEALAELVEAYGEKAAAAIEEFLAEQEWLTEENIQAAKEYIEAAMDDPAAALAAVAGLLYEAALESGVITEEDVASVVAFAKEIYGYVTEIMNSDNIAEAINELMEAWYADFVEQYGDPDAVQIQEYLAYVSQILKVVYETNPADVKAAVEEKIEEAKAAFDALLYEATHGIYYYVEDGVYVVLGSDTVAAKNIDRDALTYYDTLKDYYEFGTVTHKEQAQLLPWQILDYVKANLDTVADANFITFELDATSFVYAILDGNVDWSLYIDEEYLDAINTVMDTVKSILEDDFNEYVTLDPADVAETVREAVEDALSDVDFGINEALEDEVTEIINTVISYIEAALEMAEEAKEAAIDEVKEFADAANDAVADLLDAIEWAEDVAADLRDNVADVIEKVKEVLNDDWSKYATLDSEEIINMIKSEVIKLYEEELKASLDEIDEAAAAEIIAAVDAVIDYLQNAIPYLAGAAAEAAEPCVEFALANQHRIICAISAIDEFVTWAGWLNDVEIDTEAIADIAADALEVILENVAALYEMNAEELVPEVKAAIIDALVAEFGEDVAALAEEGAATAEAIVEYIVDFINNEIIAQNNAKNELVAAVSEAVEDAKSALNDLIGDIELPDLSSGVEAIEELYEEIYDIIASDWSAYELMTAEEILDAIDEALAPLFQKAAEALGDAFEGEVEDLAEAVIDIVKEQVGYVQDLKESILDSVNTENAELILGLAEQFAYAAIATVVNTSDAIDAIREVNPDATFALVGMYNPFQGLTLKKGGETIDLGEYTDYLVDATNFIFTALAMAKGNFVFVAVPDAETNGFDTVIDMDAYDPAEIALLLLGANDQMLANEAGHDYIAEKIIEAIEMIKECEHEWEYEYDEDGHWTVCTKCGEETEAEAHVYDDEHDLYCNECGYKRIIIGDFDEDGYVDKDDSVYLLYYTQFPDDPDYALNQNGDYDGDGLVTRKDAVYHLYHTFYGEEEYPLVPVAEVEE